MMYNKLHVSSGNNKLGKTANVSLLPIVTCPMGTPCAKDCYARRLCSNKETIAAWTDNTAFAMHDPRGFISAIHAWLSRSHTSFFRWHVAGDIPSGAYQLGMIWIAKGFPDISFLCFTKRADLDWTGKTENLRVFFSAWPGDGMDTRWIRENRGMDGIAWQEGDPRAKSEGFHCKGLCSSCRACWDAGLKDLILKKH